MDGHAALVGDGLLEALPGAGNLVERLSEADREALGRAVVDGVKRDEASRETWKKRHTKAVQALGATGATKSWPFEGASNVRFPLLLRAVIQFGARVGRGILQGNRVVLWRPVGVDPDGEKARRAERLSVFMSDQLLDQQEGWWADMKRLTYNLPLAGHAFKKVTWSDEDDVPTGEFVSAVRVIVNNATKDLKTCPRITHEFELYPYQVTERLRSGRYAPSEAILQALDDGGLSEDEHKPLTLYECHLRHDLDGDGYQEPYVVTVDKETQAVLRVEANWRPQDIVRRAESALDPYSGQVVTVPGEMIRVEPRCVWIGYEFLPDPEGGYYGMGLGRILESPQEVIDTLLNQLIDAGTLANTGGGFIAKGVNFSGPDSLRFRPGEYKYVNATGAQLRDDIVPMTFPGPDSTLFSVLGLMIDAGKEASGVTDVLAGDVPRQQAMGTTLALIEQGQQVFSAVTDTILEALKKEFRLMADLNRERVTPDAYQRVLDHPEPTANATADFAAGDADVRTTADARTLTDMQRMGRAQFLGGFLGAPGVNAQEILRRMFEAANIEDVDELFVAQDQRPDPIAIARMAAELAKTKSEIAKNIGSAVAALAKAEAEMPGQQLPLLIQAAAALRDLGGPNGADPGGVGGLVGGPGGPMVPPGVGGAPGQLPGGLDGPLMGPGGPGPIPPGPPPGAF